ncbi:MAG: hypothetical protein L3J32_00640 [Rhizobiaceae bacterium]|nr:hypothetical protein [Rhizobiaceae bacterium]
MNRYIKYLTMVLMLTGIISTAPLFTGPAVAQFTIQLGGDFGQAKAALTANGYSRIQLVGQGFTKFQVEACQKGVRYWFKSDGRGRVNQKRQIGLCAPTVSVEQARNILKNQGYSRINIEDRGGNFLIVACLRNERLRVNMNYQGQLVNRRVLGPCQQNLSPSDVQAMLRKQGFTQIKFLSRQLPIYIAEACIGKRKLRLDLSPFGEILREQPLGNCRGPLNPDRLASFLEQRGFSRVVIIDNRLPRYIAEVCEGNSRFELTLNRYGDIIERYNTGVCSQRVDRRQLVDGMRNQGFTRISVRREDANGFLVEACNGGNSTRFEFNVFGEINSERDLGACKRLSIKQVSNKLTKRNFRNVEVFVRGCRNGKLIRFKLDEYGDRSKRKVLGNC